MHELAVTESILEIAQKHALKAEATRVTDIYLVIGRLSSLIDESIQFYWDILAADTLCKGATLHFKRIPAKMICLDCGTEYEIEREMTPCTSCASNRVKVTSGDQFWLESIEIEK